MRELKMNDAQLTAALTDLGTRVSYPAFSDLRGGVLGSIAQPRRRGLLERSFSPRYGLAPAILALALLLLAVLAAQPGARSAAEEILRLRGIEIFRGPVPTAPPATPTPSSPASALGLGELVTLDEARRQAGFALRAPTDPVLGSPDEVYVLRRGPVTMVSFVYVARDGIPTSPQAHVAAIVSEIGNATVETAFFGKLAGPDTRVVAVTVNGGNGFWLEGRPHDLFYRQTGTTTVLDDQLRLAGNTLVWEQDAVLIRIEAQVDEATALRFAASLR